MVQSYTQNEKALWWAIIIQYLKAFSMAIHVMMLLWYSWKIVSTLKQAPVAWGTRSQRKFWDVIYAVGWLPTANSQYLLYSKQSKIMTTADYPDSKFHGSCRPQVGPMLATWTLLSRMLSDHEICQSFIGYKQIIDAIFPLSFTTWLVKYHDLL